MRSNASSSRCRSIEGRAGVVRARPPLEKSALDRCNTNATRKLAVGAASTFRRRTASLRVLKLHISLCGTGYASVFRTRSSSARRLRGVPVPINPRLRAVSKQSAIGKRFLSPALSTSKEMPLAKASATQSWVLRRNFEALLPLAGASRWYCRF